MKRAKTKRKWLDAKQEREAKRRTRKSLCTPKGARLDAARRYAAAQELNLAVRAIDTSAAPIVRGSDLPPLCACHHEPMRSNGEGGYRCGVQRREHERQAYAKNYARDVEKRRRSERRRRARLAGVRSEAYTRQELYERDGGRCRYCDEVVGAAWHVAHLLALARGGEDTLDNVAVSCSSCNVADGVGRLPVQLHLPRAA